MTKQELLKTIADLLKQWDADNLDQLSGCDIGFTDGGEYSFTGTNMCQTNKDRN